MAFDPLTAITGLVTKGLDKFIPDKMSEAEKEKLSTDMQQFIISTGLTEDQNFRNFILQYEGKAEDVPKFVVIIRAMIRPILTILVTGSYIYGFLNPETFSPEQMAILKPATLIVLLFWFGEKTIQKSGILDVLGRKNGQS